jgi:tetratricopeptide (TPR) repeat protein
MLGPEDIMRRCRPVVAAILTLALLCPAGMARGDGESKAPEKLGKVTFATSCDPKVQAKFERAVALLHSFWYREGRETFESVLADDGTCAIATWGVAAVLMSNPIAGLGPAPKAAADAQAAIARGRAIGARTQRERDYIEAVAAYYQDWANHSESERKKARSAAFETLARTYPDDYEAQAFHALYLAATQSLGDKTYGPTLRATEILEPLFVKNPEHPGVAHYLIHAYDYPPIAAKGVAAARRYADIAPSVPHALHMPSHIFTRVGSWPESVQTNRRSAAAALKDKDTDETAHAMDYMTYAFLQMGQDREARRTVDEMLAAIAAGTPRTAAFYAGAAAPARYVIERGAWREAKELQPRATSFPYTEAMTHFARALGAARSGDPAAADDDIQKITQLRDTLKAAKNDYWANEVEVNRLGASAWTALARGKNDEAVALMRAAADMEDASDKNIVTPGRIVPARELLGEMLLTLNRPAEALAAFEASHLREPDRFRGLSGAAQAAARAGDAAKARRYYGRLVEVAGHGDPRPDLAEARAYLARN